MFDSKQLIVAMCLCMGMYSIALAQTQDSESRGELLYVTHCSACHAFKIHWRKHKLATDWDSLVAQIRRWQAGSGLSWNNEDVVDVAHYLNAVHYRFSERSRKGYSQGKKPYQLQRGY